MFIVKSSMISIFINNSQTTRLCVEANGQAADGTLLYNGGPQAP